MNYFPGHEFEEADDGDYCAVPVADDGVRICAMPAGHPVHAGRPDVEDLARQLAGHQWRTDRPALAAASEHRRHRLNGDCALCRGDVHAIAAACLAILDARGRAGPSPASVPDGGTGKKSDQV